MRWACAGMHFAQITLVVALAGCATTTSTGGAASMDAVRAFIVAESGFDAAVETADVAARSGKLSLPTAARIKALADTGYTYVVAGRAAVGAVDSHDLVSETSALTVLIGQLAALSKG